MTMLLKVEPITLGSDETIYVKSTDRHEGAMVDNYITLKILKGIPKLTHVFFISRIGSFCLVSLSVGMLCVSAIRKK